MTRISKLSSFPLHFPCYITNIPYLLLVPYLDLSLISSLPIFLVFPILPIFPKFLCIPYIPCIHYFPFIPDIIYFPYISAIPYSPYIAKLSPAQSNSNSVGWAEIALISTLEDRFVGPSLTDDQCPSGQLASHQLVSQKFRGQL